MKFDKDFFEVIQSIIVNPDESYVNHSPIDNVANITNPGIKLFTA